MNLFQIECFMAVAESLNFTHAADSLYITQPALSRSIAALEEELGTKLFDRTKRSVKLTAAGREFYDASPRIFEVLKATKEKMKMAEQGKRGIIRLGIQKDAFEPFSVDFINLFRSEYPDVHLDIIPDTITGLHNLLEYHSLDAIVGSSEHKVERKEKRERMLLRSRQECAVFPVDHPLADRESISMVELAGEKFVVMSRKTSVTGYDTVLEKGYNAGFVPNIVQQCETIQMVMMMVALGKGVSILYEDLAPYAYGRLKFVRLTDVKPFNRWLIWNEDNPNPCLESLIESGRKYVEMYGTGVGALTDQDIPALEQQ